MTDEDWEGFIRMQLNCHICNKSLIKDEYLDSLPVFKIEEASEEGGEKCNYRGQWHKRCYYKAQKEQQWRNSHTKTRNRGKGAVEQAKSQVNCYFCEKSLLEKNFRDAVKDHCHMTGRVPRSRAQRM